ncbi:MAG: YecA family protein [bacterium]
MDKRSVLFPFSTPGSEETYLINNLKKKTWNLEEQTRMFMAPSKIMTAFSQTHNFHEIFSNRYKNIRRLYKNYRQQYFPAPLPRQNVKIGRNEPCPCDSGKKYKKCCMLNKI